MSRNSTRSVDDDAIAELRKRVSQLEAEMQESRRLNRRLAEMTDLLQELLLPAAKQDTTAIEAAVSRLNQAL
jgi:hypothetical protein